MDHCPASRRPDPCHHNSKLAAGSSWTRSLESFSNGITHGRRILPFTSISALRILNTSICGTTTQFLYEICTNLHYQYGA
jgi:hypothetical protein